MIVYSMRRPSEDLAIMIAIQARPLTRGAALDRLLRCLPSAALKMMAADPSSSQTQAAAECELAQREAQATKAFFLLKNMRSASLCRTAIKAMKV